MVSILEELTEGDRVNIMTFSSSTSFWRQDVVEVTGPKIIEEAIQHVESIRPGGCKNHTHQFCFDSLPPTPQIFSHFETGLLGLNQY